jgi:hypothetical protein
MYNGINNGIGSDDHRSNNENIRWCGSSIDNNNTTIQGSFSAEPQPVFDSWENYINTKWIKAPLNDDPLNDAPPPS